MGAAQLTLAVETARRCETEALAPLRRARRGSRAADDGAELRRERELLEVLAGFAGKRSPVGETDRRAALHTLTAAWGAPVADDQIMALLADLAVPACPVADV